LAWKDNIEIYRKMACESVYWIYLAKDRFQVKEGEMGMACNTNGRREKHIGYWWESRKERDHWEDQDVGEWTILKWILEMGWDGVDWIYLGRERNQ
jgi:hypothetical protein